MPDARDHRHGARGHRARQALVVEGHEVLEGTAASHEQDAVGRRRNRSGAAQALHELRRSSLALHLGTHAHNLDHGVAAAQGALHIVDDRTGQRGHDGDAGAEHGDAALALGLHEPLATELLRELRDLLAQQPLPRQGEGARLEAHLARGLVQVERTGKQHLQTVAQIERALVVGALPHDALERGRLVLDLKIAMAATGVRTAKPGHLAQNGDLGDAVQGARRQLGSLRNRQGIRIGLAHIGHHRLVGRGPRQTPGTHANTSSSRLPNGTVTRRADKTSYRRHDACGRGGTAAGGRWRAPPPRT
ncbi:Uncharacterised protein [Collinsella intestinalis]|nr:Uncharacterised protein [Collinsella intestinalis]